MMSALPPLIRDAGAVVIYLASLVGVLVAASTGVRHAVRATIKPDIDAINKRIDDHMGEEEAALDRVAYAVEAIASHVGVPIPPVVRGGSDEGDVS